MAHDTITRPFVSRVQSNIPKEVWEYAAGLFDADGHVHNNVELSVSQALKGITCLHFLHRHFGGAVELFSEATETCQAAYHWRIRDGDAIDFALELSEHTLLKKRELNCWMERFIMNIITYSEMDTRLKKYREIDHDDIPDWVQPSNAYFGGFFDGDGCFDANGKNYQHHSVSQRSRPICDAFLRRWGGNVYFVKDKGWKWEIYRFADKFLIDIAPYIRGKYKQVELLMNMKPGEGQKIHALLHELKGKRTPKTPKIDAINNGNARVYKRPPKELPVGVHYDHKTKSTYLALLRHDKVQYLLGIFKTAEEASKKYIEVRTAVEKWKKNLGPPVDLSIYTRDFKATQKPKPPPPHTELPLGVYLTAANTYQVRYHINAFGKYIHQLGTFKTVDEAMKARITFEELLKVSNIPVPSPKNHLPKRVAKTT